MDIALDIINAVTFNDTYISRVTKTSIMGNTFHVTWDYCRGNEFINELDDYFTIDYYIDGDYFTISGPTDEFDSALRYINNVKKEERIIRAYDSKTKRDVTEYIRKIAGPRSDFYSFSVFEVQCEFDVVILDENLCLHNFSKGDFFILEK